MRRTGFLRSKCKSVLILIFINPFQQFKNLSSNLCIWSFLCRLCCFFRKFLNFVKNEFWNLCVAQAFWCQNVKVSYFCYLWPNSNNLKTYHQISSNGSFLCRFCCLLWKFLNFVKNEFWNLCVAQILRSNYKSVIILLFMTQFQQFKNLSSNLINWKLLCRFCCLFWKFLNFVKNEFWNLCVAGLSRFKLE